MKFSILIATRNRPQDLAPCLESMVALDHDDYEIVVLDQSTTDESECAAREAVGTPERLRYIRSATVGKSAALNLLVEAARGEILAFTDDDCIAPPDWLRNFERVFAELPDVDIVFGQVTPGQCGTPEEPVHTPCMLLEKRRFLRKGEIAGMGANMAMRRAAACSARYDTRLGPGTELYAAEEGDFFYRAQRAGARAILEPSVTLVHRAGRSYDEWNRVLFCYGTGDAAFALKHLRCGDPRMLGLFLGRYAYIFARLCYRLLCRRPHQEEHYLRGYRNGIRTSLRYRVDRASRLYAAPIDHRRQTVDDRPSSVVRGRSSG